MEDSFLNYCKENIPYFQPRYERAWDIIATNRCPAQMADRDLFSEIETAFEEFCDINGYDVEQYDIEELIF